MRHTIVPPEMELLHSTFHYAPGVLIGNYLHIAGQVGRSNDLVVYDDPEAQFVAAWENLGHVLRSAGGDYANLVDIVSYHIEIATHLHLFKAVRDRYLPPGMPAPPTWTAIGVSGLAKPGLIVEIKALAWIG